MVTKNTREYTRHRIRSNKAVSDVKINSASLEDDVPFLLSTVGELIAVVLRLRRRRHPLVAHQSHCNN
jgi:hypothetical protein